MPNGYRRGGQYTRGGKTYYRRGSRITPVTSQLGLAGTDLAGLGWFLGSCELALRGAWGSVRLLWRGGQWAAREMETLEQRTAPKPRREREASALTFTLEEDSANGWLAGDVQCKVHHARRVAKCRGCAAATREQREVSRLREERAARKAQPRSRARGR